MMTAAPAPITARITISSPHGVTWLVTTDATPNRASPASSTFRRPSLSPSLPTGSRTAAVARV